MEETPGTVEAERAAADAANAADAAKRNNERGFVKKSLGLGETSPMDVAQEQAKNEQARLEHLPLKVYQELYSIALCGTKTEKWDEANRVGIDIYDIETEIPAGQLHVHMESDPLEQARGLDAFVASFLEVTLNGQRLDVQRMKAAELESLLPQVTKRADELSDAQAEERKRKKIEEIKAGL